MRKADVGRAIQILLVMAIVAAACGGTDDPVATTSQVQATTAVPGPPETTLTEDDLPPWDPDVVEELIALEAANGSRWTIQTALEAVRLLKPIDVTRLISYLGENFDAVPSDEWDAIFAAGPAPHARLVTYQTETERLVYQGLADRFNTEIEDLTNLELGMPIYVSVTDKPKVSGFFAGTWVQGRDTAAFELLFEDAALMRQFTSAVTDLLRDNPAICIVMVGQELATSGADEQTAGLFHEVVHCHQKVIHPAGPAAFAADPALWMDEGFAGWAGEWRLGGTETSARWWNEYFKGGKGTRPSDGFGLFGGGVSAISFFSMLDRAGLDMWDAFEPWFGTLRGNGVTDVARYEAMTSFVDGQWIASYTASATRREDFGPPWDSEDGPGSDGAIGQRAPKGESVGAASSVTLSAETGQQRYWAVEFETSLGMPWLIEVSTEGPGTYKWDLGDWDESFGGVDPLQRRWCLGEGCVCDDGTAAVSGTTNILIDPVSRPVLHAALFGGADAAAFTATLQPVQNACGANGGATGADPLDACLVGTWNPDPAEFRDFITRFYRASGISISEVNGTIDLTFTGDGEFAQIYNGVNGTAIAAGQAFFAEWFGGTSGSWETSGGVMSLTFSSTTVNVTINGIEAPSPPVPTATVEATYSCSGNALVIDAPPDAPNVQWPLPDNWTKVR